MRKEMMVLYLNAAHDDDCDPSCQQIPFKPGLYLLIAALEADTKSIRLSLPFPPSCKWIVSTRTTATFILPTVRKLIDLIEDGVHGAWW